MNESALVGLAILKANWDEEGKSPLHSFLPFVAHCMLISRDDRLDEASIQACIASEFGIDIPQPVLKTILKRAVRQGLARRDEWGLVRDSAALDGCDLSTVSSEAHRELTALVDSFRTFVEEQYDLAMTDDEAEEILFEFVESRSVPILRAMLTGQSLESSQPSAGGSSEYLVSSFVSHLFEADPQGFDYLERLVKGSMLSAVIFFPDAGRIEKRFSRLDVYLDTPFLLNVLGFRGEPPALAAIETLDLLYELGAHLVAFDVTVEELRGVLRASASSLRGTAPPSDVPSAIDIEFRRRGLRSSDVEMIAQGLESRLKSARINVKPVGSTEDPRLDRQGLEEAIQDAVGYVRRETLDHDAVALEGIFAARGGRPQAALETGRAVFATTNANLVEGTLRHFRAKAGDVPVAMLAHELATLAWLKKPLLAPDLPRKQILADCFAALQPSERLWRKYVEEADRLRESGDVSDDDFLIMRHGLEARSLLMRATRGDAGNLSTDTVLEILERTKTSIRADLEEEVSRLKAALAASELQEESARTSTKGLIDAQRARARRWATAVSGGLVKIVFPLLMGIMGAILLFSALPSGELRWRGTDLSPLRPVLLGLLVLVTFANLVWGTTLVGLTRRLDVWLAKRLTRIFERLLVPEGE